MTAGDDDLIAHDRTTMVPGKRYILQPAGTIGDWGRASNSMTSALPSLDCR